MDQDYGEPIKNEGDDTKASNESVRNGEEVNEVGAADGEANDVPNDATDENENV